MISRCKYHKLAVGLILSISYTLSALSALDCKFAIVDIGFPPQNSNIFDSKNVVGIGLWSFEDTSSEGSCTMSFPLFPEKNDESLTVDDDIYNTFFIANDRIITSIRILSLAGLILATINLVIVWASQFNLFDEGTIKRKTSHSLYIALVTFVCEGLKIGLVFTTSPCNGEDFWERIDGDNVSTFSKADQCFVGRGCYMSIISITLYAGVILHLLISIIFTDYSHLNEPDFEYDDVTLPSFLSSLGKSIISKVSSSSNRSSIFSFSFGSSNPRSSMNSDTVESDSFAHPMITSGFYQTAVSSFRRKLSGRMATIHESPPNSFKSNSSSKSIDFP